MVVFIPFDYSVAPNPFIFIIELNFILNNVVTRKLWPFKNIKSTPICSVL